MNDSAAIERIIQASVPFAALPAAIVTRIADIGHTVDYKEGDTIYDAGAPADVVYLLLHGQVEHVFTPGVVGTSDPLRLVVPGGLFGWSALLTNQPGNDLARRLAKTVSRDDSRILVIPAQPLMDILASAPDAKLAVVRRLLDMVRDVYGFRRLHWRTTTAPWRTRRVRQTTHPRTTTPSPFDAAPRRNRRRVGDTRSPDSENCMAARIIGPRQRPARSRHDQARLRQGAAVACVAPPCNIGTDIAAVGPGRS